MSHKFLFVILFSFSYINHIHYIIIYLTIFSNSAAKITMFDAYNLKLSVIRYLFQISIYVYHCCIAIYHE